MNDCSIPGGLRRKVVLEMGVLCILTTLFLILFPKRPPLVDIALAGVALLGVAASVPYTREKIWRVFPERPIDHRWKRCCTVVLWVTIPSVLIFLAIGGLLAYRNGGWPDVRARIFDPRILAVFGVYLLWALMQQALFQFFLLGRLLVLSPARMPALAILLTGICISLVHLPDLPTTIATAAAGILWTCIYYRYRLLLPLAFSHAALGTAFFYGLLGHNLAAEWNSVFR
jgi:hypothetical protein